MYSIGGIYDIKLRTNTEFGAFRITDYVDALDIVENNNLWLWTEASSVDKRANEFGLISETFKLLPTTYTMLQNDSFLTGSNNEIQAKREFKRNATVAPKDLTVSGQLGHARMYWSQGSNVPSEYQYVGVADYQGFFDTYTQPIALNSIRRYWNWLCLSSTTKSYFLFGSMPSGYIASGTNPSDQSKGILPKTSLTYDDSYTFSYDDYINGADELMEHVSSYDSGQALNGYFAVYRGCWKGGAGYFVRNDGVDPFFRLKSFYKTESVTGNELSSIKKLPEMSGTTKVEGQLVPLTNGVFFFNNTGSISAYNDTTGTWETGGPSLSSIAFKSVQDTTVVGFDNPANTLLAASDGDYLAYLSFDYSTSAFIKFNGQNLTFSSAGSRPAGEQFTMAIY